MSDSGKQDRGKGLYRSVSPLAGGPTGLNVIKRSGQVQPFNKAKLVASISKAGATPQQASLVTNRVISGLTGFKHPVPSSQLSSMVTQSLGQVNPKALGQYVAFQERKLRSPLAPTAKGAAFARAPSAGIVSKPSITIVTTQKAAISPPSAATKPTRVVLQTLKPTVAGHLIQPSQPKPDLIIEGVEISGHGFHAPNTKDFLEVIVYFRNAGNAQAVFEAEYTPRPRTIHPLANFEISGYQNFQIREPDSSVGDGVGPVVIPPNRRFCGFCSLGYMPKGSYTVKVVADPDGVIDESNEQNNEYHYSFDVVEPPPLNSSDLVVDNLEVTTTSDPAGDTTLIVTIRNIGIGPADYTAVKSRSDWASLVLALSGLGYCRLDTTVLGIPSELEPNSTFQMKYRTFIDMTPQTYTWTFKVNPQNSIRETNTGNNEARYEVVIGQNRAVLSVTRV